MHPMEYDDGDPVWLLSEGEPLVPSVLAWERLGVGNRCEAWLAWSVPRWCAVVVKVPRPHQVAHPRAVNSLAREASALIDNPHPVLPRLYGSDLEGPLPHVVIEYVDGPALDELIDEEGPLDRTSVALLGTQLLAALVPLHARGIAHLDMKPDNVVVRDGRPVLVDFGGARLLGSQQPPGRPVGTRGYAAPEMEACEPITAAMDVYGVGATLAEALTGCQPTEGGDSLGQSWSSADPVAGVVARLMSTDPAGRPDVAGALELLAGALPPDHEPWPRAARPAAQVL